MTSVSWLTNVFPVPKESASSNVGDYRPTSITPVLSKVLETWRDTSLTVSHHLQVSLHGGKKGRLVQLDFSVAFGSINHCGLLYKLRCIGVGGQFLSIVSRQEVTCVFGR